jgi:hypothetical protein
MKDKYKTFKKPDNLLSKVGISNYFSLYSKEINDTVKYRRILNNPILEKLAIDHSKVEERKNENKSIIVLVHPFYLMADKKKLNEKTLKDFNDYFEKLNFVLHNSYPNFSLVLYDSHLGYLSKTGKLAEKGCFDKIFFSEQDSGKPVNKQELNYFNKKKVFVGGVYNGGCLSRAITEIRENSIPKKIRSIKDLVLEPIIFQNKKLKPKKIYDRWGKKVKSVKTNDILNILEE